MRVFILVLWFTLILGDYALAGTGMFKQVAAKTPIVLILGIGLVCSLVGEFLIAVNAGTYGKLIRTAGLLSAVGVVIDLAIRILGKIFSL